MLFFIKKESSKYPIYCFIVQEFKAMFFLLLKVFDSFVGFVKYFRVYTQFYFAKIHKKIFLPNFYKTACSKKKVSMKIFLMGM